MGNFSRLVEDAEKVSVGMVQQLSKTMGDAFVLAKDALDLHRLAQSRVARLATELEARCRDEQRI